MFLAADTVCITLDNVSSGLVVCPARVKAHLMEEFPFMATENMTPQELTRLL